jgi:hypothetical protein
LVSQCELMLVRLQRGHRNVPTLAGS